MRLFLSLLFLLLVAIPCTASAEERDWAWVRADSLGNEWFVVEGSARVRIADGKIEATLNWDYDPQKKRYTVAGSFTPIASTIAGKKSQMASIKASSITWNSDAGAGRFVGTYAKTIFQLGPRTGKSFVREVIILTDSAGNMIGLTRQTVAP